jgi:DNA-directed RNA polymerase
MTIKEFNLTLANNADLVAQQCALEAEAVDVTAAKVGRKMSAGFTDGLATSQKGLLDRLPMMTEAVDELKDMVTSATKYRTLIMQSSSEALAFITLKMACNALTRENVKVTNLAAKIGSRIKELVEYEQFSIFNPAEAEAALYCAKKIPAKYSRIKFLESKMTAANFTAVDVEDVGMLSALGYALLVAAEAKTELFSIDEVVTGRNQVKKILTPTPLALKWIAESKESAILLSPVRYPMIVPPRSWSTMYDGGYINTNLHPLKLVKSMHKANTETLEGVDMPDVYSAVNTLQQTPWKINKFILETMQTCLSEGVGVAGLDNFEMKPVPKAPYPQGMSKEDFMAWLDANDEKYREYSAIRAEAARHNNRVAAKALSNPSRMELATKFQDREAIYFPYTLDFRGRVYPVASFVSPQGDDASKALLKFAVPKELGSYGAYWLHVHAANCYGADKIEFDHRVLWTAMRYEEIKSYVADPLTNQGWLKADKPFGFLAVCQDIVGWLSEGDAYKSSIPVAMDGSCSGLQHFSAMTRDVETATAVNLVAGDNPRDVYKTIADAVETLIAERGIKELADLAGKMNRGIPKQPVMTTPYGVTTLGIIKQLEVVIIKQQTTGLLPRFSVKPKEMARLLAPLVIEAIGEKLGAAGLVQTWLMECASITAKAGEQLMWTSKSGFLTIQDYREVKGKRVNILYEGVRYRHTINKNTSKRSVKRQSSGISPNCVHSGDGSHLAMTVNRAA